MSTDWFYSYSLGGTQYLLSPLYYIIDMPYRLVYKSSINLLSKQELVKENTRLLAQNVILKAKMHKYATAEKENKTLRELLSSSGKIESDFTHAEIIAEANSLSRKIVIINKGANDDVYDGQAVIDSYGVLGHVITANKYTSSVLLITDKESYVPVQTNDGERAIVVGSGDGSTLELLDATATTKFKIGDKLFTSGLALRYLAGYPVGIITAISDKDKMAFVKVVVSPYGRLNNTRQVLLVWQPDSNLINEARAKNELI
jgi:rod shape-determining protein MreC